VVQVTLKRIVKLDTGLLGAGSFVDLVYAPEVDLKLKCVKVVETTAGAYSLIFLTFYIGDAPFFFPDVSATLFQPLDPSPTIFDLAHPKGVYLKIRVTNSDTTTRRLLIHLIYED
jgi:hypothetical protein